MRMLVADKLLLGPLEELEVLGVEIAFRPELKAEDLPEALRGADSVRHAGPSLSRSWKAPRGRRVGPFSLSGSTPSALADEVS